VNSEPQKVESDSEKKSGLILTTGRIEALTDGIFAFAMTLLVLNLSFPDSVTGLPDIKLRDLLFNQAHRFFNYALSFILLAIFWIVHHQQFHQIKHTDSRLLWINIFILMFVALMPFSTDLIGDFSGQTTSQVFFATNLLILGLLFMANWAYATQGHRLIAPDLDRGVIARGIRRNAVAPAISVIVILLSFVVPEWSLLLYLLVPVVLALKPFRR
jgi:uncharacterized membrane protein